MSSFVLLPSLRASSDAWVLLFPLDLRLCQTFRHSCIPGTGCGQHSPCTVMLTVE